MADVPLERLVAGATSWLATAGLEAGDRLAITVTNDRDALARSLACMLAGVVEVPVPPDTPADDRRRLLADADPTAVDVGLGDEPGCRTVGLPADGFADVAPTEPDSTWPRTRPLAYTSGTTGERKGVHVGVHDASWGRQVVRDEAAAFDDRHGDRHLVVSPLYHSGPLRHAAVVALTGGEVEVLPHFDVELWHRALVRFRPTSLFCVPTHLHRLLDHPDTTADHLASLTLLAHAGAPCPVPLKERLLELAPDGAVWEFYGSTEGQFTVCPPDVWQAHPGSVGCARPDRQIELRDVDDEGVGTVWVHAPAHARWSYWRRPEATDEAWDDDAFTVGDLGRLDDGVLTLAGRPGDLVITGGVNVYPAEVERVLLDHPDVADVVVFGRPDDEWGQRVEVAVVPRRALGADALLAWARPRLAAAHRPRVVHLVDELPRTPTGKVHRPGLDELGGAP